MVSMEALVRCGEKRIIKNHLRPTLRSGHTRQGMTIDRRIVVVAVEFNPFIANSDYKCILVQFPPKNRNLKQNEAQSAGADSDLCCYTCVTYFER